MDFLKTVWALLLYVLAAIGNFFVAIGRFFRKIWRSICYGAARAGHKKRIKKSTPPYAHCYNCGQELRGMYCHICGQYARDINPSFVAFIRQYFENAFQWDGKFFRTFRELFVHPGRLSVAFAQGHVARYVFPLKMYMFVMVIFGFVIVASVNRISDVAINPVEINKIEAQDKEIIHHLKASHALDAAQTARIEHVMSHWGTERSKRDQTIFSAVDSFRSRLPFVLMFAMPFFAVLTRLFFRRRYKRYIPHFVYAIHLHTALFIVMIFALPLLSFDAYMGTIWLCMVGWFFWYSIVASRRFFGSSWVGSFFKNLGVLFFYLLFCIFVFVLGFVINMAYDAAMSGQDFLELIGRN